MYNDQKKLLIDASLNELSKSYAPYSHFHVAAAVLCEDGTIVTGVNVENASYSATVCAERSAIFRAVSKGHRKFLAIAVCGGRDGLVADYCPPCGVCRQVMREFCDPERFHVILVKSHEEYKEYSLEKLLPMSFGPDSLPGKTDRAQNP